MSIYASLEAPSSDHAENCGIWVEDPEIPGVFEEGPEETCTCKLRGAPIVYQGSHILPSDDDPRNGSIDIALIPDHITRDGRDDAPEDAFKWWLRLGVHSAHSPVVECWSCKGAGCRHCDGKGRAPYVEGGDATVVLDRPLVEQIRDTLDWWLSRDEDVEGQDPHTRAEEALREIASFGCTGIGSPPSCACRSCIARRALEEVAA